jgi:DNA-binding beta-propeller fold protein YncE
MPSMTTMILLGLALLLPPVFAPSGWATAGKPAEKIAVLASGDLKEPFAIDWDKSGNAYISEMGGNRISLLDKVGKLSVFAGTGEKGLSGDGGPAAKAQFNGPHHLMFGPDGDLYVADTFNSVVRKIDLKSGIVTRVAGTGKKGFSGEGGPAVNADFGNCFCLALDPKGEKLYVCDLDSRRIRAVVLKSGITVTVAGNGQKGVPKDGEDAKAQPLVDPRAVACDSKGNVYILERGGHALRVVDPAGRIRTVAGTGKAGLSGDGGAALQAQMNGPKHLSCDKDDNVLIADTETHTVRLYTPKDGKIRRVAGTGKKGSAGAGGAPEQVELNRPHGATSDPSGAIVICDSDNNRVLRIEK